MLSHARVVIIGGGMMGAGLLYHLAEEGWTDVLLVEKGELTSGSTWHAAGQCPSFVADYNMAKIHHYGNTLYPKLEEMTDQYVSWHGCGGIRFALTPEELEYFRHVEGVSRLIGYRMEIIGPDEIKKINPHVNLDGVLAGAWTLDDGHVDPAGCCNALARGAQNMGAKISRRNRVMDLKQQPGGEWEVYTEQGMVLAKHVVNAAGCYARQIQQMVGGDVPITNMKHQYVVTDPIQEFIDANKEMPVMRDPYPSSYYRQEQKGALIGIYETEHAQEAWASDGGIPKWESENELFDPDLEAILPYMERVMERMPIWAEAGIRRVVNGAIPHTPDANPLLGPAQGLRNFWLCAGSSIGIAQGAGCGKYLAQWIVHGESEINMAAFDPRRFGKWADPDYVRARSFEDYNHMYKLHVPGEERPAGRDHRLSPLHNLLKEKGGLMAATAGWERVKYYTTDGQEEQPAFRRTNAHGIVGEECRGVMNVAGIADLSGFAKFDVRGPDAEAFLDRLVANKIPKRIGGIALCHFLNQNGYIEGEATITRLSDDHFYVLSGISTEVRDMDWMRHSIHEYEQVEIHNVTEKFGNLVIAGPRSRDILASLTQAPLDNQSFKWLTAQEITVADVPLRALRVNYVGELGWELHCPMDRLVHLYKAICSVGEPVGMVHFGTYALNSMRLEKAYRGMTSELTNEITMIEADMERFISQTKDDFMGKTATANRKQQGVKMKLVYFEANVSDVDSHGGETVIDSDDRVIGVTTSGGYGHRTKKSIGFAYVEPAFSEAGSTFSIIIMGEARSAKVLANPVYDADNLKLRA